MNIQLILYKIKSKARQKVIGLFRNKNYYYKLYTSYWHSTLSRPSVKQSGLNYYSAVPNPLAGIGHQLANWIAGYWYAKQFGLSFAYIPFSQSKWETFFGFGQDEVSVSELVIKKGYKKVNLPLFDETNQNEINLTKKIIQSYAGENVVFVAEQDQFYKDQYGVIPDIKKKFYNASARKNDNLIFSKSHYNIAIHVRRGDITIGQQNGNENLLMRWQTNDYFQKVLRTTVENLVVEKPIAIYLFSQGVKADFKEFENFNNIHFCLDMGAQDSFIQMVYADLLITSKSSFSYKPALLNKGIKVCPRNFWHGYPESQDWILVEDNGNFEVNKLNILI